MHANVVHVPPRNTYSMQKQRQSIRSYPTVLCAIVLVYEESVGASSWQVLGVRCQQVASLAYVSRSSSVKSAEIPLGPLTRSLSLRRCARARVLVTNPTISEPRPSQVSKRNRYVLLLCDLFGVSVAC